MSSTNPERKWLKALRKSRGHSAPWLAARIGVTRDAVYRWESGDLKPSSDNIFNLAKILGDVVIDKFRSEHEAREVAADV